MFRVTTLPLDDISKIAKTAEGMYSWILIRMFENSVQYCSSAILCAAECTVACCSAMQCNSMHCSVAFSTLCIEVHIFLIISLPSHPTGGADFSKDFFEKPAYLTVSGERRLGYPWSYCTLLRRVAMTLPWCERKSSRAITCRQTGCGLLQNEMSACSAVF